MTALSLYLKVPSEEDEAAALAYREKFVRSGETMDGSAGLDRALDRGESFGEWLRRNRLNRSQETVEEGLVPASTFYAYECDGAGECLVGMIDIRHELNDFLRRFGGHIGSSVAQDQRRHGVATEMLRLALLRCRDLGLERVLITCFDDNLGSAKTIEHNGGVLSQQVDYEGRILCHYWITTV